MLKRVLLFVLVFCSGVISAEEWKYGNIDLPDLEINDIRFTNRARCAVDSEKPTDSAFVLIQNVDAAKAIYRLAQATGHNGEELTKMGVQVYRYAVVSMLSHIHRKLIRGELPLLPVDTQVKYSPRLYKTISESCRSDEYCDGLDEYVGQLWKVAGSSHPLSTKKTLLGRIDTFDKEFGFLPSGLPDLNCNYLKKFSPLEANLYGTKPDERVFEEIARTNIGRADYLANCYDMDAQNDMKVGLFQIDLKGLKEREWQKLGFDYWNSLKLYFSWAWRYAPEMNKMAAPMADVLRSVSLEESVMIIPTGCKSIIPAKCDGDYLQLNTLREFAKADFKKRAPETDILAEIPEGPQKDLLENEFPAVNTDILGVSEFENSEKWMENFRDNLARGREFMKHKLIRSVNFLNLVTANVKVERILKDLEQKFSQFGYGEKSLDESNLKNELYYLCGEFTQAHDKEFSFIRGDLEILRKTTLVDDLAKDISHSKTEEFFNYYTQLADKITKACNAMNQHEVWDEDFTLDKEGFSKWYLDKMYEGDLPSKPAEKLNFYLENNKPLLSYGVYSTNSSMEDILCINASHCARKTLAAMIDLHAVAQYANTFWSMDELVKTPALFNPYAERTVCKVYDPWFKTKQIIFDLFVKSGQAAMSAFVPGAVFADFELMPGRVVSFKELVKEGKIHYDVKRKRTAVIHGLMADFGKMLGIPCTVSINRYFDNPYNLYTFSGVSVGACYGGERTTLNVRTASDMDEPESRGLHACASCTLNFETVTNSLTAISNFVPYAGTGMFLFEGMLRLFKNLQDPHNIPRTYKSNPNHVLNTYRKFGNIPKKCVRKLRDGKQCLGSMEEEKVAEVINERLKGTIKGINSSGALTSEVSINGCDEKIKVSLKVGGNHAMVVPPNCQFLLKGQEETNDSSEDTYVTSYDAIERERVEKDRNELESRERARIERERVERDRLEREKIERERLESELAPSEILQVEELIDRNCYLNTKRGRSSVNINDWEFEGIKEVGRRNARWFIKNPQGKDISIYRSRRGANRVVLKNIEINLGDKFQDSIQIYAEDKEKSVSIKGCWGFDVYKSKFRN